MAWLRVSFRGLFHFTNTSQLISYCTFASGPRMIQNDTYESKNVPWRGRGPDPGGSGRTNPLIHTCHRYPHPPVRSVASARRAVAQQGEQDPLSNFPAAAIPPDRGTARHRGRD